MFENVGKVCLGFFKKRFTKKTKNIYREDTSLLE